MLIPNLKSDLSQVRIFSYAVSHHVLYILAPFTNDGQLSKTDHDLCINRNNRKACKKKSANNLKKSIGARTKPEMTVW